MADHLALHRKLRLLPGTTLWTWSRGSVPEELMATEDLAHGELDEATAAALVVGSKEDASSALTEHVGKLAELDVVWVIYPKGNKADINRNSLWNLLAEYNWRAVSNYSVNEELSAIRIRPLKPGETVRGA